MAKTIVDIFNAAQQLYITTQNENGPPGDWFVYQMVSAGPAANTISSNFKPGKLIYTPSRVELSHSNVKGTPSEFLTVLPASFAGNIIDNTIDPPEGNPGTLTITAPSLIVATANAPFYGVWAAVDGWKGIIDPAAGTMLGNDPVAYIQDNQGYENFEIIFLGVPGVGPVTRKKATGENPPTP